MAYNFGKRKERGYGRAMEHKCKAFASFYIDSNYNSIEAARKLGYSEKTLHVKGQQLLSDPRVQKHLKAIHRRASKKNIATVDWRKETLQRIADINADKPSAHHAIAAIAELNKMDGNYAPTKTESKQLNVTADLSRVQQLLDEHKKEY